MDALFSIGIATICVLTLNVWMTSLISRDASATRDTVNNLALRHENLHSLLARISILENDLKIERAKTHKDKSDYEEMLREHKKLVCFIKDKDLDIEYYNSSGTVIGDMYESED